MARVIGNFKFEHPQWVEFITRSRNEIPKQKFFNQMRWYAGATNVNFGVGQLSEEFLLRDWVAVMRDRIVALTAEPDWDVIRESTYCACGIGAKNIPFKASNYLDAITRRYHYVVSGQGQFRSEAQIVGYQAGDVLAFDAQDYDKEWTNSYPKSTEQMVFCLGHKDSKDIHNWDLFAQFHTKGKK